MNLQGYIKKIGTPREWTTKEKNEKRWTYPITLSLPFIGADCMQHEDELIADHTAGNPDYIAKLQEACENHSRMEFRVGFSVRQWEGKEFNNIKLYNIQIMI